jgi:hypothetical protein
MDAAFVTSLTELALHECTPSRVMLLTAAEVHSVAYMPRAATSFASLKAALPLLLGGISELEFRLAQLLVRSDGPSYGVFLAEALKRLSTRRKVWESRQGVSAFDGVGEASFSVNIEQHLAAFGIAATHALLNSPMLPKAPLGPQIVTVTASGDVHLPVGFVPAARDSITSLSRQAAAAAAENDAPSPQQSATAHRRSQDETAKVRVEDPFRPLNPFSKVHVNAHAASEGHGFGFPVPPVQSPSLRECLRILAADAAAFDEAVDSHENESALMRSSIQQRRVSPPRSLYGELAVASSAGTPRRPATANNAAGMLNGTWSASTGPRIWPVEAKQYGTAPLPPADWSVEAPHAHSIGPPPSPPRTQPAALPSASPPSSPGRPPQSPRRQQQVDAFTVAAPSERQQVEPAPSPRTPITAPDATVAVSSPSQALTAEEASSWHPPPVSAPTRPLTSGPTRRLHLYRSMTMVLATVRAPPTPPRRQLRLPSAERRSRSVSACATSLLPATAMRLQVASSPPRDDIAAAPQPSPPLSVPSPSKNLGLQRTVHSARARTTVPQSVIDSVHKLRDVPRLPHSLDDTYAEGAPPLKIHLGPSPIREVFLSTRGGELHHTVIDWNRSAMQLLRTGV